MNELYETIENHVIVIGQSPKILRFQIEHNILIIKVEH